MNSKERLMENPKQNVLIFLDVYSLKAKTKKEKLAIKTLKEKFSDHVLLNFELGSNDPKFFDFVSGIREGLLEYL